MIQFRNLTDDDTHIVTETKKRFSVIEHVADLSVSPDNAMIEYFMREMKIRKKQLVVKMDNELGVIIQAGEMQWMAGDLKATTGVKGAGDLLGKMLKSAATNESAIKPEYQGSGVLMLEPTYKYILLEDVSDWKGGIVVEDGMFLAADASVMQNIQTRNNLSSAVLGNEGLFNLKLSGEGICALESNVPRSELIEVHMADDTIKIDGSFAVCWSASLEFTVERAGKSLIGSVASGEGLVNVYRGTGKLLMSPLTPTSSLYLATH